MKRSVQQKYYAAAQEILPDNKIRLTLLEEAKDTASCQAAMRQPEFAQKHAVFVDSNLPFRVVIIREEPAVRIVREPSELAKELAGQISDPAILARVMITLAKHDKDVGGKLVVREEVGQEPQEEAQEPLGSEITQPPAPMPPPAPVVAPKIEMLDPAGKVPKGWEKLDPPAMLEVVKQIYPQATPEWTKAAMTAGISNYLVTQPQRYRQPIVDLETTGILGRPPAPAMPPTAPPGSQAYMETEPSEDVPVDPAECPPDNDANWAQADCPGCRCLTWHQTASELRRDPVDGYPEHNCPWYLGLKQKMVMPPPPPGPPPTVQPPSPPAPPAPPASEGMVRPGIVSGQAPMFGRGFGVPPLPPKG